MEPDGPGTNPIYSSVFKDDQGKPLLLGTDPGNPQGGRGTSQLNQLHREEDEAFYSRSYPKEGKPKLAIYISGPLTTGIEPPWDIDNPQVVTNMEVALGVAESLITHGLHPFVPHLTMAWHTLYPHQVDYWMTMDFFWLTRCDALLRLPGESTGADQEVEEAGRLAMPIFYNERSLYAWATTV